MITKGSFNKHYKWPSQMRFDDRSEKKITNKSEN